MLHAVIMAGGSGTRFWPVSRNARPKQLLNLTGADSMLQATLARLDGAIPLDRTFIATSRALADPIRAQLPQLAAKNILVEPCKRDTAPCIGLAALAVMRNDPDAIMAVMPSDHVISPENVFRDSLLAAAELVKAKPSRIVTFGIKPTYPAESFGYIERGAVLSTNELSSNASQSAADKLSVFSVARFREKPAASAARGYMDSGRFYWNSGIFVWSAATILESLKTQQPEMFAHLIAIESAWDRPDFEEVLDREFTAIRGISIDYAVMEHATDVVVIEAPFVWDDVGSWQAIGRLATTKTDADGNTIQAKHLGINTSNCIVRSEGEGSNREHLIVTLGLKDCIVVHTPDATLVARKDDEESIRQVVKQLQERGWDGYL